MAGIAMPKLLSLLVVVTILMMIGCSVDAGKDSGTAGGSQIIPDLQRDFYMRSCPNAEAIVTAEMTKIFTSSVPQDPLALAEVGPNVAPDLLRLHFHDCFVQGCDASVLLDVPGSEKTAPPNVRLEGFDAVDAIKAALEAACPGVVSCSDVLAFAARDAVVLTGGTKYAVPGGRRDGFTSIAALANTNLPGPQMSVDQLTANFRNQGLSRDEMVILSGAHTIGDVACHHIDNRLYNFPKTRFSNNGVDPSLPPTFVTKLKSICPAPGLQLTTVDTDQVTPIKFDTQFYKNLQSKRSVLSSDQVLFEDWRTRPVVNILARSPNLFTSLFADAMVKMGHIGSLRGPMLGEVRLNCRKLNSQLP